MAPICFPCTVIFPQLSSACIIDTTPFFYLILYGCTESLKCIQSQYSSFGGRICQKKCHLYLQCSINEDITNPIHSRSTLLFFGGHFSATEITRHKVNRYLSYLNSSKDKGHASDAIYLYRKPLKSWKPLPLRQQILGVVQIRGGYIQTRDSFFYRVYLNSLKQGLRLKKKTTNNYHQCILL